MREKEIHSNLINGLIQVLVKPHFVPGLRREALPRYKCDRSHLVITLVNYLAETKDRDVRTSNNVRPLRERLGKYSNRNLTTIFN